MQDTHNVIFHKNMGIAFYFFFFNKLNMICSPKKTENCDILWSV